MKRTTAFILAVLLLSLPVISYTEQTIYQKEENIGRDIVGDEVIESGIRRVFPSLSFRIKAPLG